MLIVLENERTARKALFAADRDGLFGGQHLTDGVFWTNMCPILSTYSSQPAQRGGWRGS
jgi:hypothetical protein